MKKLLIALIVISSLLVSCGEATFETPTEPKTNPITEPVTEPATEAVTEPVLPPSYELQFSPQKSGIYNYCPCVITEDDGTRYIYYCTNKDTNRVIDYIGCRKGVPNSDGSYTWSEETLVLSPSERGAWDAHHTCDPTVIKGEFVYNGTEYSYLMAYLGCTSYDNQENKIGLAAANSPTGPFVKVGSEPILDFKIDPTSSVFQWGVGQASLVSMDKAGKVWMFYTRGGVTGTSTLVRECDFSDLNNPVVGDEIILTKKGLNNLLGDGDYMNNADFVYDPEKDIFYAASDCHPNPTDTPNYISSHFRITYFKGTELDKISSWRTLTVVSPDQTGFARNHNVGFARDEYGHTLSSEYITVYYTVSETGGRSLYTYRIYEYNHSLSKVK